jgi:hypothetical protein
VETVLSHVINVLLPIRTVPQKFGLGDRSTIHTYEKSSESVGTSSAMQLFSFPSSLASSWLETTGPAAFVMVCNSLPAMGIRFRDLFPTTPC